jgi:alkaline phosphatase D
LFAGDSHQNWVWDAMCLGKTAYDTATSEGTVGVEFAGTAVSSSGQAGHILTAREKARVEVQANKVLKWQEGYYRGYFVLVLGREKAVA